MRRFSNGFPYWAVIPIRYNYDNSNNGCHYHHHAGHHYYYHHDCQSHLHAIGHTSTLPVTLPRCRSHFRAVGHTSALSVAPPRCRSHFRAVGHISALSVTLPRCRQTVRLRFVCASSAIIIRGRRPLTRAPPSRGGAAPSRGRRPLTRAPPVRIKRTQPGSNTPSQDPTQ